jgi:hypothetical protein
MSTLDKLGLPTEVGILIFTLGFVCALAPYFGGSDFGVLRVPQFTQKTAKVLKRYGWLAPLLGILLFVPMWAARATFNTRVQFEGDGTRLDCPRLANATATLRIGTDTYKALINERCLAEFRDIPAQNKYHAASVEVSGASSLMLFKGDGQQVSDGRPLVVILKESDMIPRLHIAILPYQSPDPSLQSRFEEFREGLADKILNVSQGFAGRGAAFSYLSGLKVLNDGPSPASAAELGTFWNESHALQLVRGQVESGARPTKVHSLVFLGALAPQLDHAGLWLDRRPQQPG